MLPALVQKLHLLFSDEGISPIRASAGSEVPLGVLVPLAEGDAELVTRVFAFLEGDELASHDCAILH
jgi:hypothetical protein